MTPFDMACPECSNSLRVSDPRLVGHRVKCPKCKHQFAVTAPVGHELHGAGHTTASHAEPANGDAHRPHLPSDRVAARSGSPPGYIGGDVQRLRTNGAEAAAELAEFLKKMRGKSPQEMLGLVAQSGLMQGVVQATVWTVVLMALLTVVPYGLAKAFPTAPKAVAENAEKTPAKAAPKGTEATGETGPTDPASKAAKALKKMGEDDTKTSNPGRNPLENSADDLLKDLK
jgi:predicted Zn finger-like uncharacterized protein